MTEHEKKEFLKLKRQVGALTVSGGLIFMGLVAHTIHDAMVFDNIAAEVRMYHGNHSR
jgi:hypothetical protein